MKKISKIASLMLILALLLCSCGRQDDTSGEKEVKDPITVYIGTTTTIENAVKGEYNFDMLSTGCAQPAVICLDAEGYYFSHMVTWETQDSKTWVFTLVSGPIWSDGQPMSPKDIAAAIEAEESFAGTYEQLIADEDAGTLTIVLTEPNVRFLSNMTSVRPLPAYKIEKSESIDDVWCGPFVLEGFDRESGSISFVPNPSYDHSSMSFEKIVYRLFSNEDTMYMALQNGDIDMIWNYSQGVSASYQDVLSQSDTVKLYSVAQTNLPCVLCFNNSKGFFVDENLRLAVSCALDYDILATYLGGGNASTPNRGMIPETIEGYKETEKLARDLDAADKYMTAAGYTKAADGFYEKDGKAAEFTLDINSSNATAVSASELLKTQLESFGIKVNLNVLDKTAFQAKTTNSKSEGNITTEAAIMSFTSAGVGMKEGLASIYVDKNHAVQGCCCVDSEEFKTILNEMKSAKTLEEYDAAAGRMQDYYAKSCPAIALYWDMTVYAAHSQFTTARLSLNSDTASQFADLYIDLNFALNDQRNWNIGYKGKLPEK